MKDYLDSLIPWSLEALDLVNCATYCLHNRNLAEAEEFLRAGLESFQRPADTALVYGVLADLLRHWNRRAEALDLLNECIGKAPSEATLLRLRLARLYLDDVADHARIQPLLESIDPEGLSHAAGLCLEELIGGLESPRLGAARETARRLLRSAPPSRCEFPDRFLNELPQPGVVTPTDGS